MKAPYATNEHLKMYCNHAKIPSYRTQFDKDYLQVYDPLALNAVTFPAINNPALTNAFLGTPTSLNIANISESYTTGSDIINCRQKCSGVASTMACNNLCGTKFY